MFDGFTLTVTEELPENAKKRKPATVKKAENLTSFVPRSAVSRPRAGIGASRKAVQPSPAFQGSGNSNQSASASNAKPDNLKGKSQDDFRKLLNK